MQPSNGTISQLMDYVTGQQTGCCLTSMLTQVSVLCGSTLRVHIHTHRLYNGLRKAHE